MEDDDISRQPQIAGSGKEMMNNTVHMALDSHCNGPRYRKLKTNT